MPDGEDGPGHLARRLDHLFRTARPQRRRWTNEAVAAEIKASNPNIKVSGAYLSALRTGKRLNPSTELQAALARFFGVSPAYFIDPEYAQRVDAQLAALAQMEQTGVRAIALRAVGLPPESLAAIATVIDKIRELQGLPPIEE